MNYGTPQTPDEHTSPPEDVGLYNKYEILKDGVPVEGRYFVLKPDSDRIAAVALLAYALATPNEKLADDLLGWLREIEWTPP